MADIVLKDANGNKQTYTGISKIKMTSTTGDDVFYNEEFSKIGKYFVKVIDYDGTVLLEARGNTGDVFSLPTPPTHDRLVFQEWSCSQEIVDNKIAITDNNVMAGAVYTTKSGASEFDIELTKVTGLTITFNANGLKNWGDGTEDALTSHTYPNYGNYTIVCDTGYISGKIFNQTENRIMQGVCKCIRLGNSLTRIPDYNFTDLRTVETITIPNTITSAGYNALQGLRSLIACVVPTSLKFDKWTWYFFQYCWTLKSVVLPHGMSTCPSQLFNQCYSLSNIVIPSTALDIGGQAFCDCYSIKKLCFGEISSIDTCAFCTLASTYLSSFLELDFSKNVEVPSLKNTDAFKGINPLCKIIVPDALYDEWVAATNWTTYADYIYKASEVQND